MSNAFYGLRNSMKKKSIEELTSSIERAKRLRVLREALRLSRSELGHKYGIPAGSIQNWEDARYGGLSEKGAKKLVKAFQAEGIVGCDFSWLFYGVGDHPLASEILHHKAGVLALNEDEAIAKELALFYQLNKDVIDCTIADDDFSPCFLAGDLVAGKRCFGKAILKAIGHICIAHLSNDSVLVRLVSEGEQRGRYTLTCLNAETKTIKNAKLFSAAPILWMRRRS